MRPRPELFSISDLQTPGVIKTKLEWDQQDQERRLVELQRFEEGKSFNYEPYHYPWCAACTPYDKQLAGAINKALTEGSQEHACQLAKESVARGEELIRQAQAGDLTALQELAENGRATRNPVTGEIMKILYAMRSQQSDGAMPTL